MRFPPNVAMEFVLVLALFAAVAVMIFAMREPPGDRTRITLERSEATAVLRERRVPPIAEEALPGR